jgi:hypothetical protein
LFVTTARIKATTWPIVVLSRHVQYVGRRATSGYVFGKIKPRATSLNSFRGRYGFSNPIVNAKAYEEKEYVKQPIQKHQEIFPELQVEWSLGGKVLVTSSRASPSNRATKRRVWRVKTE